MIHAKKEASTVSGPRISLIWYGIDHISATKVKTKHGVDMVPIILTIMEACQSNEFRSAYVKTCASRIFMRDMRDMLQFRLPNMWFRCAYLADP